MQPMPPEKPNDYMGFSYWSDSVSRFTESGSLAGYPIGYHELVPDRLPPTDIGRRYSRAVTAVALLDAALWVLEIWAAAYVVLMLVKRRR